MSRAFVKESDGADGEDLPELIISAHRNLVTPTGRQQMEERVSALNEALTGARAAEDRAVIARVQRDLRYWTERLRTAEVMAPVTDEDIVRFGLSVLIEDRDGRQVRYQIVGEDESDPGAGKISYVSPLGQALMGCGSGDEVTIGERVWEILEIG